MSKFEFCNESTIPELFQSAVNAFPATGLRQHATDTIRIVRLDWTPFVGMKTLVLKGLAQNEGREYSPIIMYKDVKYHQEPGINRVKIMANGQPYILERIADNEVQLRCNCADFLYRFGYYNHLDRSLYGRKPRKYESSGGPLANPSEKPGMCKHLIKMSKAIFDSGLLS
jgi:hypothetical protein